MRRKILPAVLTILYLAAVVPAQAQQPTKVQRIGYLSSVDRATESGRAEGIRLGLRELGYIEETSPSSTGIRRGSPIGPPSLRLS